MNFEFQVNFQGQRYSLASKSKSCGFAIEFASFFCNKGSVSNNILGQMNECFSNTTWYFYYVIVKNLIFFVVGVGGNIYPNFVAARVNVITVIFFVIL